MAVTKPMVFCRGCQREVWESLHNCPSLEFDSLGDRMKSYEDKTRLDKGQAVVIRIDGKAFHTWTRKIGAEKPFDQTIINAMASATYLTFDKLQGCRLAYTQSDEASFCLIADGEDEQGWFGFKTQKLVSTTASYFTYYFNREMQINEPGFFDGRAYAVPLTDVANVFVWRQQDFERNSIQALGQSVLGHREMQGLGNRETLLRLKEKDCDWESLAPEKKYGIFVRKSNSFPKYAYEKYNYYQLNEMMGINVTNEN